MTDACLDIDSTAEVLAALAGGARQPARLTAVKLVRVDQCSWNAGGRAVLV